VSLRSFLLLLKPFKKSKEILLPIVCKQKEIWPNYHSYLLIKKGNVRKKLQKQNSFTGDLIS